MTEIEIIIKAARELGELISNSEPAKKFEATLKKLQEDTDAQRILNDYNRHMQSLAQKEQQGAPIEVDEKHKLQELKKAVATNRMLGELQMIQMDYLDLMQRVDDAMSGSKPDTPQGVSPGPTSGPIVSE